MHAYIHTYIHIYILAYIRFWLLAKGDTVMRSVFFMWTNQVLFFTVYTLKDLQNFWHYNKFILSNLHGKIRITNRSMFFNAMG